MLTEVLHIIMQLAFRLPAPIQGMDCQIGPYTENCLLRVTAAVDVKQCCQMYLQFSGHKMLQLAAVLKRLNYLPASPYDFAYSFRWCAG